MEEKRKSRRLKDENEITVNVISAEKKPLQEKLFYNYSADISVAGARIKAPIFLPAGTILMIEMTLKTLHQMITVLGKVKWARVIFDNESFEAGVEFFNAPGDDMKQLSEYIRCRQEFSLFYVS